MLVKYMLIAYCVMVLFLTIMSCVPEIMVVEKTVNLIGSSILGRETCEEILCSCSSIQPEFVFVFECVCLANNLTLCVWSVQRTSDQSVI